MRYNRYNNNYSSSKETSNKIANCFHGLFVRQIRNNFFGAIIHIMVGDTFIHFNTFINTPFYHGGMGTLRDFFFVMRDY